MTKTKVVFFQDNRGNLGNKINEFLQEQSTRSNDFKLISIEHGCGSTSQFGVWVTALILFSFTEEVKNF